MEDIEKYKEQYRVRRECIGHVLRYQVNEKLIQDRTIAYLSLLDSILGGYLFSLSEVEIKSILKRVYRYTLEKEIDYRCSVYFDRDIPIEDNPIVVASFGDALNKTKSDWRIRLFHELFPSCKEIACEFPWERNVHIRPNDQRSARIISENMPGMLYKYRTVTKHSLANLENDTLWMSNAKSFNDLFDSAFFEGIPTIDEYRRITKDSIDKVIEEAESVEDNRFLLRFLRIHKENLQSFGGTITDQMLNCCKLICDVMFRNTEHDLIWIGCLSERNDSNPMWAYYADDHKGFCIGYSGLELLNSPSINECVYPVYYSNKSIHAWMEYDIAYYELFHALHKSKEWEHEQEWRIVLSGYRSKEPFALQLPTPKAVYLGARMPGNDKEKILSITRKKGIKTYQVIPNTAGHTLRFVEC